MNKKSKKTICLSAIAVIVLVALDQLTKYLAVSFLKDKPAIPIIKDVFELQYLENQSAAFGMDPVSLLHNIFSFKAFNNNPQLFLDVKMGFFILATVVILGLFLLVFLRIPAEKRFYYMDLILIFFSAGAIGNFIDRVTLNYVVDFLYFKLINFPIFNVADIYVTCSAFALIILGIFYYKDEDLDRIFPSKKKGEKA